MDNAIEACDKIEDGKDKYIELKMFRHSDYLIIKIKNTYSGTVCLEKNRIRTEKKDKQNHGYGLLLLEKIAKKYRGKMKLEVQEQCFINLINIKIY